MLNAAVVYYCTYPTSKKVIALLQHVRIYCKTKNIHVALEIFRGICYQYICDVTCRAGKMQNQSINQEKCRLSHVHIQRKSSIQTDTHIHTQTFMPWVRIQGLSSNHTVSSMQFPSQPVHLMHLMLRTPLYDSKSLICDLVAILCIKGEGGRKDRGSRCMWDHDARV